MKNLKLRIVGYDKYTNSLIVSFASDINSKPLGSYPSFAYQPHSMGLDETDINEVVKTIALRGIAVVNQQYVQENFIVTEEKINQYTQLVGTEFEFSKEELDEAIEDQQAMPQPVTQGLQTL